ncbi:MAG: YihY/virulence factor BrkB family protein [Planctomyces sp.]|nr:YihY/virulence factor BrkB family protein [Planctomyces sp.]
MAWSWLKRSGVVLWRTYTRWQNDDGPLMSAAVAYYLSLSLFPALLLLITGIGLFFRYTLQGQDAEQQVLAFVAEQGSPALERQVRAMLGQIQDRTEVGGSLGIVGVLIGALAGFTQMERAFDHMWDVHATRDKGMLATVRHILIERGVAFLMLLGVGLLVVIVLIAGLVITGLEHYVRDNLGVPAFPSPLLRLLVTMFINTALFAILYRYLTPPRVHWRHAIRGGLLAAAAWELGRTILASWVIGSRYTSAYGIVGSFLAVMLWCYYAVAVIFLGGEYLKEIVGDDHPHDVVEPPAPTGDVDLPVAEEPRDILHHDDEPEGPPPAPG